MIKINLAKSSSPGAQAQVASAPILNTGGPTSPATKIIAILVFPIAIYMWEKQMLSSKKQALATKTKELDAVKAEVEKFGAVTSIVEDLKKERDNLASRLKVIQKISRKASFEN